MAKKIIRRMCHAELVAAETEIGMIIIEIQGMMDRIDLLYTKQKRLLSTLRSYGWLTYEQLEKQIEEEVDDRLQELKKQKEEKEEIFKDRIKDSNIGEKTASFEQIVEDYRLRPLLDMVNGLADPEDPVVKRMKKVYKFLKYNRAEINDLYKKVSVPELVKQEEFKVVSRQLRYWINIERGVEKRVLDFDIRDIETD